MLVQNEDMYKKMTEDEQLQLWEQGICPVSEVSQ